MVYTGSFLSENPKAVFQIIGLFTPALGMQMSLNQSIFDFVGQLIIELLLVKVCQQKVLNHLVINLKLNYRVKTNYFLKDLSYIFIVLCRIYDLVDLDNRRDSSRSNLMYTKSLMDELLLLLASASNCVLFSAIPLLIFQSALT